MLFNLVKDLLLLIGGQRNRMAREPTISSAESAWATSCVRFAQWRKPPASFARSVDSHRRVSDAQVMVVGELQEFQWIFRLRITRADGEMTGSVCASTPTQTTSAHSRARHLVALSRKALSRASSPFRAMTHGQTPLFHSASSSSIISNLFQYAASKSGVGEVFEQIDSLCCHTLCQMRIMLPL